MNSSSDTMGKIFKKLMQTKHSRGQTGGQAQCKALFFVCLFVFLFFFVFFPPFCPSISHQKNEKGSGRYRRRRERKKREKKEEKRKKREGGGRREKSVKFCFFFFFYVLCGILQLNAHNSQRHDKRTTPTSFSRHYQTNLLM